jgi:hypothetical protein
MRPAVLRLDGTSVAQENSRRAQYSGSCVRIKEDTFPENAGCSPLRWSAPDSGHRGVTRPFRERLARLNFVGVDMAKARFRRGFEVWCREGGEPPRAGARRILSPRSRPGSTAVVSITYRSNEFRGRVLRSTPERRPISPRVSPSDSLENKFGFAHAATGERSGVLLGALWSAPV